MKKINVTIWNEFKHERAEGAFGDLIRSYYPNGMHRTLAEKLAADNLNIRTVSLDEPEQGLPDEILNTTDVLLWWGHCAHAEVKDALVDKIQLRVLAGMGLIVLHSGHLSKIFRRMTGTACRLRWREVGEKERLWVVSPSHPIVKGVPETFVIPNHEMYGEPFDIPQDGKIIFMSWFEGGNVFRSGVTFERDNGKIFYFSPGHETFPVYHDPNVIRVIANAVRWAAPEQIFESRTARRSRRLRKKSIPRIRWKRSTPAPFTNNGGKRNMKKYRISFIAAGRMANSMATQLKKLDNVELAGVFDILQDKSIAFAKKYGFEKNCTSREELLSDKTVDAIVICNYCHQHCETILAALDAGFKFIFCEKPAVRKVEEAQLLRDAAAAHGAKIMIGHHRKHIPACRKLKELIEQGRLGKIRFAKVNFCNSWYSRDWNDYFASYEQSGGTTLDMVTHYVDLLNWYFGEPESASARALMLEKKRFRKK